MTSFAWTAFVTLLALTFPACSPPEVKPDDLRYMLMFDSDGAPVNPLDPLAGYVFAYEPLGHDDDSAERTFEAWVRKITNGIRASGKDKVLIFIHGGLNEQASTIERTLELYQPMLDDGYYPIFVNWQSNLLSSYRDHLLFIRRGRDWHWWGLPLAPFYLVADIASGLFTLPMVAWSQINQTVEVAGWVSYPDREHADDASWTLRTVNGNSEVPPNEKFPLVGREEDREVNYHWLRWWATLIAKPVSIFVVEAAGSGSWEVMLGRVDLLFQRESDLEGDKATRPPHGLLYLMRELTALQEERKAAGRPLEIDLVGHSMGTIVSNRLLFHEQLVQASTREQGLQQVQPTLPEFSNIVYMAAACTIREYQESVFTYLLLHDDARFFHVMLDPSAEQAERNAFDLSPRGSLLVWIDDFLARPASMLDRTAGRYDNLLPTLYGTPVGIRDRLHLYVLPCDRAAFPQKHGAFTDPEATDGRYEFWQPIAWWPWWSADGTQPLTEPLTEPSTAP